MKLVGFFNKGYYILPEDERNYFKEPLDIVLSTDEEIEDIIHVLKASQEDCKIVTVGDVSTQTLLNKGLVPNVAIIDEHVQRNKSDIVDMSKFTVVEAKNPAGTITLEAWDMIQKVLKKDNIKIIIKISGEEDLLVLPAIYETPYNSKVLYGQPNEGLVVVTVTEEIKKKVKSLIQKLVKINEN